MRPAPCTGACRDTDSKAPAVRKRGGPPGPRRAHPEGPPGAPTRPDNPALRDHHHHHHGGSGSSKPARIRTVLNEKQLHMLRACYNANPRPDALMKEHLVEMTGLNPRVIRVWFQNKRCKDKKKNLLVRPEHSLQLPTIHHASSSPFNHSHMVNNLTNNQNSLMFDNCY